MAFEKTELTNAVFTFIQIILGNLFLQKVTHPFVRLWVGASLPR